MSAWDSLTSGWSKWTLGKAWQEDGTARFLETPFTSCTTDNAMVLDAELGRQFHRGRRVRVRLVVTSEDDFWVRIVFDKQWNDHTDKTPLVWGHYKQYRAGSYVEVLADSKPGGYRPITDCDYVNPTVYLGAKSGEKITVHSATAEIEEDTAQYLWQPVVTDDFPTGWEWGSGFERTTNGLTVGGNYEEATTENAITLLPERGVPIAETVRVRVSLTSSGTGAVRLAWHRWNESGEALAPIWVEGWTRFEPGNRSISFDPIITSAPLTAPVLYVANEHAVSNDSTGTVTPTATLVKSVSVERKITQSQALWDPTDEGLLTGDWTWGSGFEVTVNEAVVQEPTDVPLATHAATSRYDFNPGVVLRLKVTVESDVPYAVRQTWESSTATLWPDSWVEKDAGTATYWLDAYTVQRRGHLAVYFAPEPLSGSDWGTVTVKSIRLYRQVAKRLPVANSPGVDNLLGAATALPSPLPLSTMTCGTRWSYTDNTYTWTGTADTVNTANRMFGTDFGYDLQGESTQLRFTLTTDVDVTLRVGLICYESTTLYTNYSAYPQPDMTFPPGTHEVQPIVIKVPGDAVRVRPYVQVISATNGTVTISKDSISWVKFLPEIPRYTERGDLQLRLSAYEPLGERIGPMPDVLSMTITQPRNDASTLSLKYAPRGVRAELFRREVELGVEYSYDGVTWDEAPGCRFFTRSMSEDALSDGTSAIDFAGISVAGLLDEVVLWEVPAESRASDGKWNFLSRNAGTILRTVWDAAISRGWGDGLTLNCTPSSDSAGQVWATITTLAFDRTITLRSVLDSLTDIGMIDWCFTGRTLNVWNADTVVTRDLSPVVMWPLACGAEKAPESKSWAQLCTDVLVKGEADNVWHFHNDMSPLTRRVEKVVSAGGVELEETARQVAKATLEQGATIAEEVKREWHADDIKWAPFLDYGVGDWVGVQRSDGMDKLQVVQTSLTFDSKGISGHTTFGTVLDDLLSRLAKKQKGIVGAASIAGNTLRPSESAPKRTPAAPSGLVGRTTPYTIATGAERALLELSWAPVAADTRGNALDGIEYEVLTQVDGEERLWAMGANPSGVIEGLHVGDTYNVYVRAKATGEGTLSSWSEGITITPEGDSAAPPAPASPSCSSNLAVLKIVWNGTDAEGDAMPADFDHLEASVTVPAALPVVVARTYSPDDREINVPGLSAGSYEVRLRAVDTTGHYSDWSDYATVTVASLVDADTLRDELEIMLPEITDASAIYQRAAALVAGGDVKWGPYPPDEGVPGKTFWIAPDGKLWIMKSKAAAARSAR